MITCTKRLIIRRFKASDDKFLYLLNSDPDVLKYTGDVPFHSVNEARCFIDDYSDYDKNKMGRWIVQLRKTQLILGWCGLKLNENGQVDLGFRFQKKSWNQGFATEASLAVLDYGFTYLGLRDVIARTSVHNRGAQRVLENIGMTRKLEFLYEGIGKSFLYCINKEDHHLMNHEKVLSL